MVKRGVRLAGMKKMRRSAPRKAAAANIRVAIRHLADAWRSMMVVRVSQPVQSAQLLAKCIRFICPAKTQLLNVDDVHF